MCNNTFVCINPVVFFKCGELAEGHRFTCSG